MNKLEADFARYLDLLVSVGDVIAYEFEPVKLKLAARTFYTPDFAAVNADRELVFYEVKGFWEEDARVKIKCAAARFWFVRFIAVTRPRGADWKFETFPCQ